MKFYKRLIALLIIIISSTTAMAKPYDTEIDGVCYKLNGKEAMVTVFSDNEELNAEHFTGKITIRDTITYNYRKYPVTSIGPKSFMLCHGVTEVYIPNTVTTISSEAFKNDNIGLEKVHIGANVKEIAKNAFYNTMMSSLEIDPANKNFILEGGVFYSADHKRAITFICESGKDDSEIKFHDDVVSIDGGFACGRRLNSVQFNKALKSIGAEAFRYSFDQIGSQTDLILPDGIEVIGEAAFDGCIRIENLHLPDSLTRLEPFSFSYVSPLYIHMPKKLKVICNNALSCNGGGLYRNLVLPEGLDSLGEYAITCIDCDSLIVPSTVRYLSKGSLDNFSRYIEIKAPLDSIAAGAMPSQSVRKLILPKTLRKLGDHAFYPCYDLKTIVWPDSLEYIGRWALAGNKVNPMVIPSTVRTLAEGALSDNVEEPRTYYFTSKTPPECLQNNIFDGIYYEGSSLYVPKGSKDAYANKVPWSWFGTIDEYEDVYIKPENSRYDFKYEGLYYKITSEENKTCQVSYDLDEITDKNTYKYTEVKIPEIAYCSSKAYTVTSIEPNTFGGTPLKTVTMPETITDISGAFGSCYALENITIPENVTDLGGTFANCYKLKSVNIPEKVTNISSAFINCTSLESINIPDGVTEASSAFMWCSSLKSVSFPDKITEIGEYTCMGCSSLTSVKLPAKLTIIKENAFGGCTNLKSIVLPAKLYIIKTAAFGDCRSLTDITSLNPEPPYPVGYSQFAINNCTLHVPAGSKDAYQAIDMWQYFNIIEDATDTGINQVGVEQPEGKIYDILGRPVNSNYKGIVIKNGKKKIEN